jgi:hypothetical protein
VILAEFARAVHLWFELTNLNNPSIESTDDFNVAFDNQKQLLNETLENSSCRLRSNNIPDLNLKTLPLNWNRQYHGRIAFNQEIVTQGTDFILQLWPKLEIKKSYLFIDPQSCLPEIHLVYGRDFKVNLDAYKDYNDFKILVVHSHLTESSICDITKMKCESINVRHGILPFPLSKKHQQVPHYIEKAKMEATKVKLPSLDLHKNLLRRTHNDCQQVLKRYTAHELNIKKTEMAERQKQRQKEDREINKEYIIFKDYGL